MTEINSRLSTALADRYDRQVAIKVLRPELAAVFGADRFVQEIKTTANLQHPHILPLHYSHLASISMSSEQTVRVGAPRMIPRSNDGLRDYGTSSVVTLLSTYALNSA